MVSRLFQSPSSAAVGSVIRRGLLWIASGVTAAIVLIAVLSTALDAGYLRQPFIRFLAAHTGRKIQIGGVLEPVGALPVIVEDDVVVGGNSGVYEGTVVRRRAVLGTGTILNRSIPVYDLVRDKIYTATETEPLIIPEAAIVVPGSRAVTHPLGAKWGLSLQAAVIVKYRDAKTDVVSRPAQMGHVVWRRFASAG